jgi:hypothetical protein
MRRILISTTAGLALAVALLAVVGTAVEAGGKASPPQSSAFGKTLAEWAQLYITWLIGGGADHVGQVQFLPLPSGEYDGGSFTYEDPGVLTGHLDVTLAPGTPFVLPVVTWYGETYSPDTGYPDDPPIPAELFTDPDNAVIKVYIDGKRVMDSTRASVGPFYYGPVPLDVVYPEPTSYGSTAAIFTQGVAFVQPPLSVGTHTIELEAELFVPPDPEFLNLTLYPDGFGVRYFNTWTITVSPKP